MSYADKETSVDDGLPVKLYEFDLGGPIYWRFNNTAKRVMTSDGKLWLPAVISDSGARQTGDRQSETVTITMSDNLAPAQLFKQRAPSAVLNVTIRTMHLNDTEAYVEYVGEITERNIPQPGTCVLVCEAIGATMEREGLRLGWQRSCPYALYDESTCKVNRATHARQVTITGISGAVVTISGTVATVVDDPSIYAGGYIAFSDPVRGNEYVPLESQLSNTQFVTFGPPYGLYVGQVVTMYRGCDRSPRHCNQFSNYDNYGGVPSLPGKSPFDGVNNPFF